MKVLALRTDKPEAELYLYEDQAKLAEIKWLADRQLSDTIHQKISDLLNNAGCPMEDLKGIVCFKGPGSFTGLRIGLSVANAFGYSLRIPVVATKDPDWLGQGIKKLLAGQNDKIATPFYGRPANTTPPKK